MSAVYAGVVAFTSGLCIMGTELAASRLLAPFFGTSTFVWTSVIGVIMVALSLGYMTGGRIADRKPDIRILLKLLAAASVFLMTVPFLSPALLRMLTAALQRMHSSAATWSASGSARRRAPSCSPPTRPSRRRGSSRAMGTPLSELARHALDRMTAVPFDPRIPTLTDDRAPVERMVDWELLQASK